MAITKKRRGERKRMGRPPGTGGPPQLIRKNRVTVMLTDAELAVLERLAADRPLGTVLYELVARGLKRAK